MRYRLEFFHPCSLVWPFVLLFCYHATDVCLPAVDKCILPSKFPSAFLLSHVTGSVEGRLAVAMQQSEQDIRDLLTQLWNREQLVATFNNLSQSMEETATPKTHTVLCSCSSSGQDSSRSTPDYYESSEGSPSNGRDIEGTREQHLHYPPNALLDPGNVNLISDKSMACLDQFIEHCQKVIGPGYEEALEKTFVDNADALSSFFYQIATKWVLRGSTDTSKFTEELANMQIVKLKFNTEVLRLMQHQLCEQSPCPSFRKIKKDYFVQFAKLPIKSLLEIALSLSEANWSANNICPMLLAYEALKDVLPIIQKFASSEYEELFSKIIDNMRKAFRGFFNCMKDYIKCGIESQKNVAIHPVTCFLIHSIKAFSSHRILVQSFLAPGADSDSFDYLLDDLITSWISELRKCPESNCPERWCIFLLCNIKHFQETDGIIGLQDGLLLNSELVDKNRNRFDSDIEQLTKDYTKSWGAAKSCLTNGSRRSMVKFGSIFKCKYDLQKNWKVPNPVLKQGLRDDVEKFILPEYKRSFEQLQEYPPGLLCFPCLQGAAGRDIYTPEYLQIAVQRLFEG